MHKILVVVAALLLMGTTSGSAEPVDLGQFCWQLAPHVDTINLEVTQEGNLFVLSAAWHGANVPFGPDVYTLEGGGVAVASQSGAMATLTIPLQNPSRYFLDNRLCQLQGAVHLPGLGGDWSMECFGARDAGGVMHPPVRLSGTLTPVTCELSVATLMDIARAEALRSVKQPTLAGIAE